MKTIKPVLALKSLIAWGMLIAFAMCADAQLNVVFNLSEFNASPATSRTVSVQYVNPTVGNVTFYTSDPITGSFTITNFPLQTLANVVIKAPPGNIPFQLYAPSDANGTLDATNFTALGNNAVNTYPAAQVAPSIQMADGRYARSGISLTNSFYLNSNPSNFINAAQAANIVLAIATTNGITAATATNIANGIYSNNPSGYVTQTITNTLASIAYVNTATNGHVTAAITNGLISQAGAAALYYPTSNPSLFVTASVTNGLATVAYVNTATNGHVTAAVTNGLLTQSAAALTYYPTSNPSSFVTASVTNGLASIAYVNNATNSLSIPSTNSLATTNFVKLYADTNGAASAAVVAASVNYQPTNVTLTIVSQGIVFTNILYPSTNVLFYTNGNGVYVVATNQTFLTNGTTSLGTTNPATVVYQWQLLSITNQFLTAIVTNGFISLKDVTNVANFFGINSTNYATQIGSALTNLNNSTSNYVTTNLLTIVTNLIGTATNGLFVLQNSGTANSLSVYSNLNLGNRTNFLLTTNVAGLFGAGDPNFNGTYIGAPGSTTWTNPLSPPASTFTISFTGTNYYAQSNLVSFYASTNGINWTIVIGTAPPPFGNLPGVREHFFGTQERETGGRNYWSGSTNQWPTDRPMTIHWYFSNNIPQYGILFTN